MAKIEVNIRSSVSLSPFRTSFQMATDLHLILFPYLLYPGQSTAMTISIFLIVAIAFERLVYAMLIELYV